MIAILLANGIDLATFLVTASILPITGESNPLARSLYVSFGPLGIVALKLAGLAIIAVTLAPIHPSPGKSIAVAVLVILPLLGAATNVIALARS